MFLTFSNVAITPDNRIDKLSENDLELIRDTAIQSGGRKVQIQLRDLVYEVSNRSVAGDLFNVIPSVNSDTDRALYRER
ncbi:hypothetical protein DNP50_24805, partial [Salmonella enterica subsp. enterica serovar Panama]